MKRAHNRRLWYLRKVAGISQAAAAKHLNITQPMISRFELGKSCMTVDQLVGLCELYGADLAIRGADDTRSWSRCYVGRRI